MNPIVIAVEHVYTDQLYINKLSETGFAIYAFIIEFASCAQIAQLFLSFTHKIIHDVNEYFTWIGKRRFSSKYFYSIDMTLFLRC